MEWYTILFISSLSIFIIKLLVSWFFGDFDMDVDFDGDSDFDTSSAFSFKGLIHFLIGFSTFLFARAHMETVNIVNGHVQFSFADYIWAILCGLIIVVILLYAYKVALKANNESVDPQDLIDNAKGIVYLNLGEGKYSIQIHTQAGTTDVNAYCDDDTLSVGTEVILGKENSKIIIKDIKKQENES